VSTPASIVAAPLCGLVLASNLAGLLAAGWFPAAAECLNHAGWLFRANGYFAPWRDVSLTPWLQPGARRHLGRCNRFNGLGGNVPTPRD